MCIDPKRQYIFDQATRTFLWFMRITNDAEYGEFVLERHFHYVDQLIDKELWRDENLGIVHPRDNPRRRNRKGPPDGPVLRV